MRAMYQPVPNSASAGAGGRRGDGGDMALPRSAVGALWWRATWDLGSIVPQPAIPRLGHPIGPSGLALRIAICCGVGSGPVSCAGVMLLSHLRRHAGRLPSVRSDATVNRHLRAPWRTRRSASHDLEGQPVMSQRLTMPSSDTAPRPRRHRDLRFFRRLPAAGDGQDPARRDYLAAAPHNAACNRGPAVQRGTRARATVALPVAAWRLSARPQRHLGKV